MSAQTFATLFSLFALGQWVVIASIYVYDATRVFMSTQRAYRAAQSLSNGRALALKVRRQASWKHLVISWVALAVGLSSSYRWAFLPHPNAQVQIFSMVLTEGLVFILFLMWRIKRDNVAYIRKLDEMREKELRAQEPPQ
jgi:hypothetical protein